MRLLLTADTVGGVFTYTVELCRGLSAFGVEVCVATLGPLPSAAQRAELEACGNVRLFSARYRLEWEPEPWADVDAAGAWLLDLEARLSPDVVQLGGYAHAQLPFVAPTVVVAHSCVASWWSAVHGGPLPDAWRRYHQEVSRGLRAATARVAVSAQMREALGAHYGEVGPVRVIPNGRTALAGPRGNKLPRVVAAGRAWDEAKNLSLLESVAPGLPWPVVVAGDAKGLGLPPPNVERLGAIAPGEVRALLDSAAIYCLPARYEPFGLSVLEAAQAGCALVLGDIPSLRENWEGAAVFVDPADPAGLSSVLCDLSDDSARRAELGAAAASRAVQFTPARMASAYAALYRELPRRNHACASSSSPTRSARTGTTATPTS